MSVGWAPYGWDPNQPPSPTPGLPQPGERRDEQGRCIVQVTSAWQTTVQNCPECEHAVYMHPGFFDRRHEFPCCLVCLQMQQTRLGRWTTDQEDATTRAEVLKTGGSR